MLRKLIKSLFILLLIVGCEELIEGEDVYGCTLSSACNYNPDATKFDDSCEWASCDGCMDEDALNYDSTATKDDYHSCIYELIINCTNTQIATIIVDGNPDDWSSLIPAVTDPEGDSVCGIDTDIKHIYTCIDSNYAYVMVETHNTLVHSTAVIEINFSFDSGELHTNISDSVASAWKPLPDIYPINEEVVIRGSVMEVKIPLTELDNTTYFNPTFVNIWDYNYFIEDHGCDWADIDCDTNCNPIIEDCSEIIEYDSENGEISNNMKVFCVRHPNDDYWITGYIIDSDSLIENANLSGNHIEGTSSFSYNLYSEHPGWWWTDPNIIISQGIVPNFPLNYTIHINYKTGRSMEFTQSVIEWELAQ